MVPRDRALISATPVYVTASLKFLDENLLELVFSMHLYCSHICIPTRRGLFGCHELKRSINNGFVLLTNGHLLDTIFEKGHTSTNLKFCICRHCDLVSVAPNGPHCESAMRKNPSTKLAVKERLDTGDNFTCVHMDMTEAFLHLDDVEAFRLRFDMNHKNGQSTPM
jgi:hypothetical protein